MKTLILKRHAYEKHTGDYHVFEVFAVRIKDAAPYAILLDGSFLATAETGPEIANEIEDTIRWFGWQKTNPNFA